jgi:glycosyltransferase involved in cell wall biosynthesis
VKILEVIVNLRVGGAEILLKNLSRIWRASGAEVTIYLLSSSDGWIEQELLASGIQIVHSGLSFRYAPWQVARLAQHLRRTPYDVIHAHLFPAQLCVSLAARFVGLNTPLVTTEHSTWNRRRRLGFRSVERFLYARYDSVICISEAVETGLRKWLAPQPCNSCVIHNGIDRSQFLSRRKADEPSPSSKRAVLLCVGSLSARKNQAAIIRALVHIPGADLVLVGEGPMRGALERLAGDLGVRERVRLLGPRRDVADLLSTADVYIQPSVEDGFCLAVVEAMSVGLPVVASNVPGMKDVVANGGILFDPNSPEALSKCVNELLSHCSLRTQCANRAKERAAEFGIDRTAVGYWNLYESLCKRVGTVQ